MKKLINILAIQQLEGGTYTVETVLGIIKQITDWALAIGISLSGIALVICFIMYAVVDVDNYGVSDKEYGIVAAFGRDYDEDGNLQFDPKANGESNGRFHTDWLNMIYPRLKIAKDLLTEDGAILISIDDNEVENLRKVCDEIFGTQNFVAQMIWQQGKKSSGNLMVVNHEYVIVYVKNHTISDTNENSWKQRKEGLDKIYNQYEALKRTYGNDHSKIQVEIRKFFASLQENDPAYNSKHYNYVDEKGLFFADNSCAPDRPESRCHKPLIHPITKKETAVPSLGWRWKEETLDKLVEEGRIYFGSDETSVPKVKKYLKEMEYELPSTVFYKDGRGASKRLESLLEGKLFDFPKDEILLLSSSLSRTVAIFQSPPVSSISTFWDSDKSHVGTMPLSSMDSNSSDASIPSCR